jgi:hypothetical protein
VDGGAASGDLRSIRCARKLHLVVDADARGVARIQCRDCGRREGLVIHHYFDLGTGREVATKRYRRVSDLLDVARDARANTKE